ncbi:NINE protein [Bifidobacterium sp. CP2]|uniref:TM2 domain-containing protein n=1 Tax=Bifidobacterium sp. CP2 TaxID=2809025 RepID=UPI001BDD49B8|nr:TM2 domain-containing protein [Bifidobacterium sp. CP2]MBT1180417.1 NINE protein [Bifidobacterium sp. CP2]
MAPRNRPRPTYTAPAYGAQPGAYGTPAQPQYGAPAQPAGGAYGAQPQYGAQNPAYGAPATGAYGAQPQYGAPAQPAGGAYGAPAYGAPAGAYGAPAAPGYAAAGYSQTAVGTKSKMVAGLLGIFLGSLGVHNFYLGYTGKAVAQLLLTLIGWIILIGPLAASIWGLVEGIMILCSKPGTPMHKDANGYELQD